MCSPFSGMVVGGGIGPFPEEGLDKAFGFAVGAGTIGPGETPANAEFGADLTESMRAITTAVVAEHALDADPESGVILDRGRRKAIAAVCFSSVKMREKASREWSSMATCTNSQPTPGALRRRSPWIR